MKNKKILFIADGCHPGTQGGVQTFGRALEKMFENKISFIADKNNLLKIFKIENIFEIGSSGLIFRVINRLLHNKLRKYLTRKRIEKINPDICILRSPQNLKILKGIKCKKILVQHNRLDRYYNIKTYYNSEKKLFTYSKKELDYFIVTSKYDKKILIDKYKFPPEKVKIIRHSCELELLNKEKIKNKNLIMIARIDNNHKRFDLAIRAMKKLPDFNLKIYGSGPDEYKLKELIKNESIKNVFLCGATEKIKEKLDKAGIFVMTSDYESYGITNIEAMRRGLPIIIRNTFDAVPDIVINNGVILNKKWNEDNFIEGINKIYKNYDFYSKNSLKLGKRHSFNIIKKYWAEIFKG